MDCGVRQGCPLSPLLYAVVADALLEHIATSLPGVWIRAYADDTVVILDDFWTQAPVLAEIFEKFGEISNLRLNIDKCVVIPLHPRGPRRPLHTDDAAVAQGPKHTSTETTKHKTTTQQPSHADPLLSLKQHLQVHLPRWQNMNIAWQGTYLGFEVGPGRADTSWKKPAGKFMDRIHAWAGQGHGLQYGALEYNSFAVSTLSYISQLEAPPTWIFEMEDQAIRKMAPGPINKWATVEDMWHLQDGFGFSQSFKCLRWLAQAAQLRVYVWDPYTQDKKQLRLQRDELRHSIDCPKEPYTKAIWRDWISRSFLPQLQIITSGLPLQSGMSNKSWRMPVCMCDLRLLLEVVWTPRKYSSNELRIRGFVNATNTTQSSAYAPITNDSV